MDIRLPNDVPTDDERVAVDCVLGPPASGWDGGGRTATDDFTAQGGAAQRARRNELVPALEALQRRVGWVTRGGLAYVCARLGIPPAEAWGVATFYAMFATSPRPPRVVHVCDDLACARRGSGEILHRLRARGPAVTEVASHSATGWATSPCLGLCDQAPAAMITEAGVVPDERLVGHVSASTAIGWLDGEPLPSDALLAVTAPERGPHEVLLARVGTVDPTRLDAYDAAGGYAALRRAIAIGPDATIVEITASGLVGRGGAAFPTGRKWAAVRSADAGPGPKYVVCNADESEPGTFKDRVLLAGDPFAIVEAMTIAGFACGAEHGYLYLRAEYPLAAERLEDAIAAALAAKRLGPNVLGAGFAFDLTLRRGAGAYICGEETALFESIEGKRGEPRSKPPFPVISGLFGRPTVVNNVETLANVLPILIRGGAAYAAIGTPGSTGTRLFCLSGAVVRPGVYEAVMGSSLRELLDRAGGILPGRHLKAILLGGAAGTFIRPDQLDLPLTLEAARAAGTTLGSGVVMVFADNDDLHAAVRRIAAFFRDESCGQCVPCRVGTVRQEEALARLLSGHPRGGRATELALLDDVGLAMRDASICGLGQTAYSAVESAIKHLRLFDPPSGGPL